MEALNTIRKKKYLQLLFFSAKIWQKRTCTQTTILLRVVAVETGAWVELGFNYIT